MLLLMNPQQLDQMALMMMVNRKIVFVVDRTYRTALYYLHTNTAVLTSRPKEHGGSVLLLDLVPRWLVPSFPAITNPSLV